MCRKFNKNRVLLAELKEWGEKAPASDDAVAYFKRSDVNGFKIPFHDELFGGLQISAGISTTNYL
jgi:hypothetical protein